MSVKVRLRRMGSNKKPFFRVVATDSRRPNAGRFLELLGWYDPKKTGVNYELKTERVEYWVSKGAIVSDTVRSLMRKKRKASPAPVVAPPAPPAAAPDAATA